MLNLTEEPTQLEQQKLGHLQSVVVAHTALRGVANAVFVERFADHDNEVELLASVREVWHSSFDMRGEERLRGIGHYTSPKVWLGQFASTRDHAATVPSSVGLHWDHAFCPVSGFREAHTQIVGFGKMQQCRERDVNTPYLEEPMAPVAPYHPMYDADGNFPWRQFETITPSIFMAVEMLPEGATSPFCKQN